MVANYWVDTAVHKHEGSRHPYVPMDGEWQISHYSGGSRERDLTHIICYMWRTSTGGTIRDTVFIYYLHLVQSEVSTDHGLYVIICLNDGYVSHRPYFVGRSIMPVSYLRSIVNMIFRLPYHWYYWVHPKPSAQDRCAGSFQSIVGSSQCRWWKPLK